MIVELQNITQKIRKKTVLQNINVTFDSQYIYGLQGKNGCGKTMLMRVISGLIIPNAGSVLIDGEYLHKQISFPKSIGVLIETPSFLNHMTGFKNLKLIASIKNKITDEQILNTLMLVGLDPYDKRVYRKYSLGMKQRLGIACAIMEEPDIVLLDEPINAIDTSGVALIHTILQKLKENGTLVILACHDREELYSLSDIIIEMEEGKICNQKNINEDS
ncbi:MAG: ATP-binding cassette domain-containing protein [Oscillospiraceae bacterium]